MPAETRNCQNCKQQFTIEPEDFNFYAWIKVPPPTWCPECRATRRMMFFNEERLFRKPEALIAQEIFSGFPAASPLKIYEHAYWWSDKWNPMDYGRDYDFSRPFFEQFKELMYDVPWPSRSIVNLVNSDYCNNAGDLRNCYLCFNGGITRGGKSENCLYGIAFLDMRDSMDFYQCEDCELCYEIFSCGKCFESFFAIESNNCSNVWLCLNCENCTNCFGCVNLRHKQYHIFNKPYSKEDYAKTLKEFNLGSYQALTEIKRRAYDFWKKFPMKYMHGTQNTNVIGEYVYRSKNVKYCYQGLEMENVRYSQNIGITTKDSYDYTSWGFNVELMYEDMSCGTDCRNVRFCYDCWPACRDLEYCMSCHSSGNCFGCVGLKKKEYCIFNKQYTKEEYFKLREKIIEHMNASLYTDKQGRAYKYGEFFPPELSPLAYNESAAQVYFPKIKAQIEDLGFLWRELDERKYETTMRAEDLPDRINDVKDDIVKEVIECMSCRKAFRIITAELAFYKRFGLPLPRLCHNCRFLERMKFRNPIKWWKRGCMCNGKKSEIRNARLPDGQEKSEATRIYENAGLPHPPHKDDDKCPNNFETAYAPEKPDIIYCEACYQNEIA